AREVSDEVALGHLGKRDRTVPSVSLGDEIFEGQVRDTRRAQLPGAASGLGQFEKGGLGIAAEQRCAGGAPTGGRSRDEVVDHHRTAFSNAETKASISARVRRSVTATRSPSPCPRA